MDPEKRKALEAAGFHFGNVTELLGLSEAERSRLDMARLAVGQILSVLRGGESQEILAIERDRT